MKAVQVQVPNTEADGIHFSTDLKIILTFTTHYRRQHNNELNQN